MVPAPPGAAGAVSAVVDAELAEMFLGALFIVVLTVAYVWLIEWDGYPDALWLAVGARTAALVAYLLALDTLLAARHTPYSRLLLALPALFATALWGLTIQDDIIARNRRRSQRQAQDSEGDS